MSNGTNTGRRRFLTAATTAVGAAGAVGVAVPFIGSWNPSAKAKAAGAPVKFDAGRMEPDQKGSPACCLAPRKGARRALVFGIDCFGLDAHYPLTIIRRIHETRYPEK